MTDFLGRTISVGDTIVYPNRFSSSMYLRRGVVRSIELPRQPSVSEPFMWVETPEGRVVRFSSFNRCVVVTSLVAQAGGADMKAAA